MVSCLLCIATRPLVTTELRVAVALPECSWRDLGVGDASFTTHGAVQVRAKQEMNGTLTLVVPGDNGFNEVIYPPDSYTLNMTCEDASGNNSRWCTYKLHKHGQCVRFKAYVLQGPSSFVLIGDNIEWSQNCPDHNTESGQCHDGEGPLQRDGDGLAKWMYWLLFPLVIAIPVVFFFCIIQCCRRRNGESSQELRISATFSRSGSIASVASGGSGGSGG